MTLCYGMKGAVPVLSLQEDSLVLETGRGGSAEAEHVGSVSTTEEKTRTK